VSQKRISETCWLNFLKPFIDDYLQEDSPFDCTLIVIGNGKFDTGQVPAAHFQWQQSIIAIPAV